MIMFLQNALFILTSLACISSVVYSFRSRRTDDPKLRGLLTARTNISMGILLILIALMQMLMYSGSTIRVIIGALLLALGLFNLFAGLKNHGHYSRLPQPSARKSAK